MTNAKNRGNFYGESSARLWHYLGRIVFHNFDQLTGTALYLPHGLASHLVFFIPVSLSFTLKSSFLCSVPFKTRFSRHTLTMAPIALEPEDHSRDAQFSEVMHGESATSKGGFSSMLNKDWTAHKAASDDYWKHWDEKKAGDETEAIREVCSIWRTKICMLTPEQARRAEYASLTRHYYNLATDIYEYGWGSCFHFCRFAYGEGFYQGIARHEHYLAHMMQIREGMRVLDVGCGVGGPAREIAKFTGANIVGLNNNDYQIERATHYAAKENLSDQLSFTKGDFMVNGRCLHCAYAR